MKKTLLICLAAVLVFGMMGIGFAMWADTVGVSVAVETGNVEIGIRDVGTNDNILTDKILGGTPLNSEDGLPDAMPLGGDPQILPGENPEGKNVAIFTSKNGISDTATPAFTLSGNDYYKGIREVLQNGYPYYAPTTRFEIAGNGTVPAKIDDVDILVEGLAGTLMVGAWSVTDPAGNVTTGTGEADLITALSGIQIHQGDIVIVDLQLWIDQNNDNESLSDGVVKIGVHACQWNEYGLYDAAGNDQTAGITY